MTQQNNQYADPNYYMNSEQQKGSEDYYESQEQPPSEDKSYNWLLVVLLIFLGLGIFLMWWCMHDKYKKMHTYYDTYIQTSRDSVMFVVAGLNEKIDSLEQLNVDLQRVGRLKDSHVSSLNRRIKDLLKNCDPVKYRRLLNRVAELEGLVSDLEAEIAALRNMNDILAAQNKFLVTQVDSVSGAYNDLYSAYLKCCTDGKDAFLGSLDGSEADEDSNDNEGSTFQVDGVTLTFVALGKKDVVKDPKKISDIKRFDISFDALSSKQDQHLFYVRVSDSIEGNIVVPSDYRTTGRKILQLPDGEEVPYTYSVGYNYDDPNQKAKVSSDFTPYEKQIRYLPYRVEIYDENGKLGETYGRPPVKKNKRRARWIW